MMSTKITVNSNLKILLENCMKAKHRCLLPIIGPNTDHIMIIHHLITKLSSKPPTILWCHKREKKFPHQNQKHLKNLKRELASGKLDISKKNALDLFFLSASIKFCSYDDTQRILGNTYSICILQDFESVTPNILCRTVETVSGGGAILLHFSEICHLRDLFILTMKVHSHLKTYAHNNIVPLFNERFVISLGWCKNCLLLDDNLQIRHEIASIKSEFKPKNIDWKEDETDPQLLEVLESLKDAEKPLPQLIGLCKTADQAKAVLKMLDVLTDKNGKTTVSISAGRGRGKSSAMGIAVAGAIHSGLSNIFVVSPSPENLRTFFDFLLKGFDALEYSESSHYDILQSVNPDFKDTIIRINVFVKHRQTIQYVEPNDWKKVSQGELVVIDEAASIPLPQVKSFLGGHDVFMASTINGYEGTGRSLSLKLLSQLRQQSVPSGTVAATSTGDDAVHSNCRPLHEITLEQSIRYRLKDPVETWMNRLLCLEATSFAPPVASCPPPSECDLYYVNRNVLLSGHKETEEFLHQVISLLVSSHYKNSPDDLQILSDAPAHHLFVLLPPLPKLGRIATPSVFCVLQVCIEGGIPSNYSSDILSRNERPNGDLIPWLLANQFTNAKITKLKSIRIVRAATHPDYQSMGYGSRAIQLFVDYYKKKFIHLEDSPPKIKIKSPTNNNEDLIAPRTFEETLLTKLSDRPPEELDFIGVSYGLTESLFKFWMRQSFVPFYVSQVMNKITGEYNCVMINPLISREEDENEYDTPPLILKLPKLLSAPACEFLHRFTVLLSGPFREIKSKLALHILQSHEEYIEESEASWNDIRALINGHDLDRLEAYSKHLVDRHIITDLIPSVATLYFKKKLPSIQLSHIQSTFLVGIGLQFKNIEVVANELSLKKESALGQFNRMMKRFLSALSEIQQKEVIKQLPSAQETPTDVFTPVDISLDQDLNAAAKEFENLHLKKTFLGDLREYVIQGEEADWQEALKDSTKMNPIVSIKSHKRPAKMTEEELEKELEDPKLKKKKSEDSSYKKKEDNFHRKKKFKK